MCLRGVELMEEVSYSVKVIVCCVKVIVYSMQRLHGMSEIRSSNLCPTLQRDCPVSSGRICKHFVRPLCCTGYMKDSCVRMGMQKSVAGEEVMAGQASQG